MSDYSLRLCQPDDEPALLDLFALVFGQVRSSPEWHWKFVSSRALSSNAMSSDSLVAVDGQGQIVAHAGALILPGQFQGRPIPIVQVCDVMVHPDHRGGLGRNNLFTLLLRELLDHLARRLPSAFRYGFPGQRPYLLGEWAGVYERLEVALETELAPASSPFNLWRAVPLAWDNRRLDRLWQRLGDQYALSLIRDGAYLRWRYAEHPVHDYQLTGLAFLGRLSGWVVWRQQGERRLLVDALIPHRAIRPALQAAVMRLSRRMPSAATVIWLPESWREALGGPHHETPVVTANMCWRSALDTQTVRQSLYYTMGDVDIF